MALAVYDRVRETTAVVGTNDAVLLGAVTGFQSFAVVGTTNTCYYTIADQSGNWEVGLGTYNSVGPTMERTTVLSSSAGGAKVNFPVGTKDIFLTYPAEVAVISSNNPSTAGYVLTSNGAGVAPSWQINAGGDVTGPASSTDTAVALFDGNTGKLIKNSGVTIDGSNNVSGVAQLNATTADLTNLEVTNIKAKDGTAAISIADSTGVVTGSTPQVISVNSASDALRITQTGAGNALLVEDSANPDSTPLVVDFEGRLIQGNTAVLPIAGNTAAIQQHGLVSQTSAIASVRWQTANSAGPQYIFAKSRSGAVGSYSIVSNGDILGTSLFVGDDGTAFIQAASISAAVDGTPGTNDMPGRLVFSTTADGASSPTERMRIDNQGRVGIGTTPFGSTQFLLSGAAGFDAAQTTVYAARANTTMPSTGTSSQDGFGTTLIGNAALHTVSNVQHFHARSYTIGASQTVSNQFGFYANASLTGATNNYGFLSNIAAGTGRYNFYANGSADNYFAGRVGIGTAPSFPLHVLGAVYQDTIADNEFATVFGMRKSRVGATVQSGDTLGEFSYFGYDGTSYIKGASVTARVDGTPSTNDMPTRLIFSTTADGASLPTERMQIDNQGNLIQSAPTTAPTLSTNGTMVFNLTSNTNLRVSVRGSDGVTRTANITLA